MSKKRCDVSLLEGALDLSLRLFLWCSFVLSSCVLPFIAQAQENSPGPVISREVDLVVLPVIVKDRNGRFVSGLTAKNFSSVRRRPAPGNPAVSAGGYPGDG